MRVGLNPSIEDLARTKWLSKRGLLLPEYVSWGIGLLLHLDLNLKIGSAWVSSLLAFVVFLGF